MSSTNKTSNYLLSQFVGSDIPSILNDYNGDMRKIDTAIHEATIVGGDNTTDISELKVTTQRLSTEMGGINSSVNTISGKVVAIESVIPSTASADNKLLTAQELPEIPSITALEEEVHNIESLIPEEASAENQLVVMEQVDDISADVKRIKLCIPDDASEDNQLATMSDIHGGGSMTLVGVYQTNTSESANAFRTALFNKIGEVGIQNIKLYIIFGNGATECEISTYSADPNDANNIYVYIDGYGHGAVNTFERYQMSVGKTGTGDIPFVSMRLVFTEGSPSSVSCTTDNSYYPDAIYLYAV